MRKRKKNNLFTILLILLLTLGLGYAFLQTDLTINGIGKINANSWNIYFDNLEIDDNSAPLQEGDSAATINPTTLTDINYIITLNKPGDFYEFTVDVVNAGTIDAMVGTVISKLNGTEITTTNPLPTYLDYTVSYDDGVPIEANHLLAKNTTDTFKVKIAYKTDINPSDLPTTGVTLDLFFKVSYIQADNNKVTRTRQPLTTFSTDSWTKISSNVQKGKIYEVGATKEVELGNGLGTHTLRVINNTTPEQCNSENFSQTACGIVIEFADIITNHRMNPVEFSAKLPGTGNIGGWPETEMIKYLNSETDPTSIYNSLPTDLKNIIIDTTTITGHGSKTGETNTKSRDKLFLLSMIEIYGQEFGFVSLTLNEDRQMDYYNSVSLPSNRAGAVKKMNGTAQYWWTRTPYLGNEFDYMVIYSNGNNGEPYAKAEHGVSPAFRIAGPTSTFTPRCEAFETDSWATIVANANVGNYSQYQVGCKKAISLGNGLGEKIIRVANNTTPTECSGSDFSQTACGFVLEFTDIVTTHAMNSIATNEDGWPASEMRTYLNSTTDQTSFYNSLPTVVRNGIIETPTISGYELNHKGGNYITIDKIYLYSSVELTGTANTTLGSLTEANTRQLDFYNSTNSAQSGMLVRYYNGSILAYWLRDSSIRKSQNFMFVTASGTVIDTDDTAAYQDGVYPAFRLGGAASELRPPCEAFENDSWATIVSNAQSNNYAKYKVGCTKEVTLGNDLGTHLVRVANNKTPTECSGSDFSQTACGFVLEFADIITTHSFNPDYNGGASGTGNVGGWPVSTMRTYLNSTNDSTSIYNSMPTVIKNAIINTKVVSGHGSTTGETNFTTTDKLYLLSLHEIVNDVDGDTSTGIDYYDTAYNNTRQLDYYQLQEIISSKNSTKINKKYGDTTTYWWLRTPYIQNYYTFYMIHTGGGWAYTGPSNSYGVSPAFRLG